MISCENGLGVSLADKFKVCSLVERRSRCCTLFLNSFLVLRNSSLACACSSIAIREAAIFAIKHCCRSYCSSQASARSLSYSALTSSFVALRALMVSMSCCKAGASLPSDPNGDCLCSSSRQKTQTKLWMGSCLTGPTVGAKCSCRMTSD